MRLQSIELREFRNHREARFDLRGDSALVLGENGTGKTNLIEALVLLSIGRSFRGARDQALTRRGAEGFELKGRSTDRLGVETEITARGGFGGPREMQIDGAPLDRLSDLLGRFCTVHFSVEDVSVLNGGPASRRRFLDIALCQLEPAYVGALRDYMAALKQRNRLLMVERHGPGAEPAEWDAWEEMLARAGIVLDRRRAVLCEELGRNLGEMAREVDPGLSPELSYKAGAGENGNGSGHRLERPEESDSVERTEEAEIQARIGRLARGRTVDRRLGWTLSGPHRARLRCAIGGEELMDGASRGYSRLYSILLRLALARVFEERQSDPPVLLLDDPESELDPRWIGRLLGLVPETSQAIVTACRELSDTPGRFRRIPIESADLVTDAA